LVEQGGIQICEEVS